MTTSAQTGCAWGVVGLAAIAVLIYDIGYVLPSPGPSPPFSNSLNQTVFADDSLTTDHIEAVRKAAAAWGAASGGRLRLTVVPRKIDIGALSRLDKRTSGNDIFLYNTPRWSWRSLYIAPRLLGWVYTKKNVAFAVPSHGVIVITQGRMDPSVFQKVAAHELGHILLGIGHDKSTSSIMYPLVNHLSSINGEDKRRLKDAIEAWKKE